jgi:murein DD-endopeptidase MepM/ murein hydrolase activator NlpD
MSSHRRVAGVLFAFALLAVPAPVIAEDVVTPETPFIWPTSGRITQPYGCTGFRFEPRRGSCAHFHGGIDVADSRGTPIRAAEDGVIAHVGWDPWLPRNIASWVVIISHGDGIQTMYAHLRDKELTGILRGERVRQGQIIGLMDSTGLSTGSHLHFSVLRNGSFINPREFLAGQPERGPRPGQGSTVPEQADCSNFGAGYGAYNGALTAAVTESEAGPSDCAA